MIRFFERMSRPIWLIVTGGRIDRDLQVERDVVYLPLDREGVVLRYETATSVRDEVRVVGGYRQLAQRDELQGSVDLVPRADEEREGGPVSAPGVVRVAVHREVQQAEDAALPVEEDKVVPLLVEREAGVEDGRKAEGVDPRDIFQSGR